ncbi:MAG: DNA-processing protein DprA [Fusobacteriaceae bacterium]
MLEEITCIYSLVKSFKFKDKKRINTLIDELYNAEISINDFFNISKNEWLEIKDTFKITKEEIPLLAEAKKKLIANSFFIQELSSNGIELIHFKDKRYPKNLLKNLPLAEVPTIVYIKGNLNLLKKKSVSIVGSRNPNETSVQFTKNITKLEVSNGDTIVSGFAKGIDKIAFESSLEYGGTTIAVLPEGINNFKISSQYYQNFVNGNILILSTFPPDAVWTTGYAMERNKYIYALGDEIYIAQSDFKKGGTWSGAVDGIKKNRTVYVRKPESELEYGNLELIKAGGQAIDLEGNLDKEYTTKYHQEKLANEQKNKQITLSIQKLLKESSIPLSINDIKQKLNITKSFKIKDYLEKIENIKIESGKIKKYYIYEPNNFKDTQKNKKNSQELTQKLLSF